MLFHNQIESYITDIPKKEISYSEKKLKKKKITLVNYLDIFNYILRCNNLIKNGNGVLWRLIQGQ